MIRRVNVILGVVLLMFLSSCSTSKPAQVASSGELLWKIEKEGLPGASYLYGTIHLMPEDDFFIAEDAKQALAETKALVLEVNIDLTMKEQLAMAKDMMLPAGDSYAANMSAEDYNALCFYLRDIIGIKESKVERYLKIKPFFMMAVVLTENYESVKMYEQEFVALAKKQNIGVQELETMAYQIHLVDSLGLMMSFPSKEELNLISEFEKMKDAYLTKDLSNLEDVVWAAMDTSSAEDMAMIDVMIKRRNVKWLPKIESFVAEQPVFIAVGVGHLSGQDGVVQLLKNRGYKLTAMQKQ